MLARAVLNNRIYAGPEERAGGKTRDRDKDKKEKRGGRRTGNQPEGGNNNNVKKKKRLPTAKKRGELGWRKDFRENIIRARHSVGRNSERGESLGRISTTMLMIISNQQSINRFFHSDGPGLPLAGCLQVKLSDSLGPKWERNEAAECSPYNGLPTNCCCRMPRSCLIPEF